MPFLAKTRKERSTVKPAVRVSFKKQGSIQLNQETAELLGIIEGNPSFGSLTVFIGTAEDGPTLEGRIFIATGVPGRKVKNGKASLGELTKDIQKFFSEAEAPIGPQAKVAKIAKFDTSKEVVEFSGARMLELQNPVFPKPSEDNEGEDA